MISVPVHLDAERCCQLAGRINNQLSSAPGPEELQADAGCASGRRWVGLLDRHRDRCRQEVTHSAEADRVVALKSMLFSLRFGLREWFVGAGTVSAQA